MSNNAADAGREAPAALSVFYDPDGDAVLVDLDDGTQLSFDPDLVQETRDVPPQRRGRIEISPLGDGLHWPDDDACVSIPGLLHGNTGSRSWMARNPEATADAACARIHDPYRPQISWADRGAPPGLPGEQGIESGIRDVSEGRIASGDTVFSYLERRNGYPIPPSSAPFALSAFTNGDGWLHVDLDDGTRLSVIMARMQVLARASPDQLEYFDVSEDGANIVFPDANTYLWLPALLDGRTGGPEWIKNDGNDEPAIVRWHVSAHGIAAEIRNV